MKSLGKNFLFEQGLGFRPQLTPQKKRFINQYSKKPATESNFTGKFWRVPGSCEEAVFDYLRGGFCIAKRKTGHAQKRITATPEALFKYQGMLLQAVRIPMHWDENSFLQTTRGLY
jgi:hypothetical protein